MENALARLLAPEIYNYENTSKKEDKENIC